MAGCRSRGGVRLLPDLGELACAADNTLWLFGLEDGEMRHVMNGHLENVIRLAISPDGRLLATGSDTPTAWGRSEILLWTLDPPNLVRRLAGDSASITSLAFSKDAGLLASGGAKLRLWRASDGWQLSILDDRPMSLAFSSDSRILAAGEWDGTIRLWDVSQGRLAGILDGHPAPVVALMFTEDGTGLVSASLDGTVRLWGVR